MKTERLTILISVLGVILTAASVLASIAQYRAADLQAQAARAALMPQIEIRALLEKRDSDIYTDRRLEISSDGGPTYNFSTDRLTWFEFRRNGKPSLEQPLTGYFFMTYSSGRIKGEMETIIGHKNHERFVQFQQLAKNRTSNDVEISHPSTILRARYSNALDRDTDSVEYFRINGGSVIRLSTSEGKTLWEHQTALHKTVRPVDIDHLASAEETNKWPDTWQSLLKP